MRRKHAENTLKTHANTPQRNMFPGLVYRMPGCPIVLLCFRSGKMVLTGGKTIEDIERGWGMLWPVVSGFVW